MPKHTRKEREKEREEDKLSLSEQTAAARDPSRKPDPTDPNTFKEIPKEGAREKGQKFGGQPTQFSIGGVNLSRKEYKAAKNRLGFKNRGGLDSGGRLTPEEEERVEGAIEAQRLAIGDTALLEETQREAGGLIDPLIEDIGGKIIDPLDITPTPLTEAGGVGELLGRVEETAIGGAATQLGIKSLPPNVVTGLMAYTGSSSEEELANSTIGQMFGLGTAGVLGGAAIAALSVLAVSTGITAAISAQASSLTAGGGGGLAAGAGGTFVAMSGVGAVTDIKGDELDALTGDLEEISSLATNILENVENEGFKWRDGVTIMTAKAQELDYVEERIQQIAILNADFRNSNEALETMNKIIDARTEVLNTLGEIRNLVLTGETKQDFTQMLISQEKLLKE